MRRQISAKEQDLKDLQDKCEYEKSKLRSLERNLLDQKLIGGQPASQGNSNMPTMTRNSSNSNVPTRQGTDMALLDFDAIKENKEISRNQLGMTQSMEMLL